MKRVLRRVAEFAGALLLAPLLLVFCAICVAVADLAFLMRKRLPLPANRMPDARSASMVIPNWNGRDLLEKYLPSVITAMSGHSSNEIIVVDNGSGDGSAAFVREQFPEVRLIALPENLGFGGGSNAGFRAARNDIVILLNSDMRVEPDFLASLLAGFQTDDVFAVSCQIFLSDPAKRREETGLTEGWWENGRLHVSHRDDPDVRELFPCFYAGGGSSAFDRVKFLELGGFDELLAPFYLEDTDLGFLAWKRGWKVLYQPASIVFHEHRGTIGKKFSPQFIHSILKKNYLLFTWKNIHDWKQLAGNFGSAWAGALASSTVGERPLRMSLAGIWRGTRQIFRAGKSRLRARNLSALSGREAFQRMRGSHFRDRFLPVARDDENLRVLFVSPYPILPPVHGGAVFMLETLRELSRLCEVHALVLLDESSQAIANGALARICASVELAVRPRNQSVGSIDPHAVEEFASRDVRWLIDRLVYQHRIDILQIEYTPMGQYIEPYERVLTALFEHDVYFQSIIRTAGHFQGSVAKAKAFYEYLRALRFELRMLRSSDQIQVCTRENRDYLLQFDPRLADRVETGLRAAIDTRAYEYPGGLRESHSMLFVGSSRHEPNRVAVEWFITHVFPIVVSSCPDVRLYLAGFDSEKQMNFTGNPNIRMLGYVENVKPLFTSCSVFVCPILSGSGVRVKLLEAFASGIPVVSTRVGAEGLAAHDGEFCLLAEAPGEFARKVLDLMETPELGIEMAARARREVETNWDGAAVTRRLERSYRDGRRRKIGPTAQPAASQVGAKDLS